MARTSLKALEIPEGVTLENNQGVITFTGKLGNLSLEVHQDVDINKDERSISFSPNKETKESLAITGTMRALTANCIEGVATGFEKKLEINGNKALDNSLEDDYDFGLADKLDHFDSVIMMGDFNYRIQCSAEEIIHKLISHDEWQTLIANDQLLIEK